MYYYKDYIVVKKLLFAYYSVINNAIVVYLTRAKYSSLILTTSYKGGYGELGLLYTPKLEVIWDNNDYLNYHSRNNYIRTD